MPTGFPHNADVQNICYQIQRGIYQLREAWRGECIDTPQLGLAVDPFYRRAALAELFKLLRGPGARANLRAKVPAKVALNVTWVIHHN